MMEFTMSRASLVICGMILFAAAVSPVADYLQSENDDSLQGLAESDARLLDALMESDYDVVYLRGDSFLPSQGYTAKVDGYFLTIQSPDGREYSASMRNSLVPLEMDYGFEAEFIKNDLFQ